jgi:hypothetical protein
MRDWVSGLIHEPRRAPLRASSPDHPHVHDELRLAYLIDADAFIVYAVNDREGLLRLLHVGHDPPEGMTFRPA